MYVAPQEMQIGILFLLVGPCSDQNNRGLGIFFTNLSIVFELIGVQMRPRLVLENKRLLSGNKCLLSGFAYHVEPFDATRYPAALLSAPGALAFLNAGNNIVGSRSVTPLPLLVLEELKKRIPNVFLLQNPAKHFRYEILCPARSEALKEGISFPKSGVIRHR